MQGQLYSEPREFIWTPVLKPNVRIYIYIYIYLTLLWFWTPRIKFWTLSPYFFLNPIENKFEYDSLNNILVFLNQKKNSITNQFDIKFGKKINKPNNKNRNLLILNFRKNSFTPSVPICLSCLKNQTF